MTNFLSNRGQTSKFKPIPTFLGVKGVWGGTHRLGTVVGLKLYTPKISLIIPKIIWGAIWIWSKIWSTFGGCSDPHYWEGSHSHSICRISFICPIIWNLNSEILMASKPSRFFPIGDTIFLEKFFVQKNISAWWIVVDTTLGLWELSSAFSLALNGN